MSPSLVLACIAAYFAVLLTIAGWTSRHAGSEGYFLGNRKSPWFAVSFGLLGDSLSGVTFISVPGQVATAKFSYLQIVLGYVAGYVVIAEVLLPLYYRLRLTSIYSYLGTRFGPRAQRTGSFFFLLSRLVGAAARLYLAANVLQLFIFDAWRIPFAVSVMIIIGLMLAYTYRGGIKTLVWTDVFQSTFLLLGVALSLVAIARELGLGWGDWWPAVQRSGHAQVFFWDWQDRRYFWKQFLSGVFIAIVMTGLDQNSMQKNLSCRSLPEARRNIYAFTVVMFAVNALFLALGALLYTYAAARGIPVPAQPDRLFPQLALEHLGTFAALVFIVGLTAATFSSADGVLTTLTTAFCIDFLALDRQEGWTEARQAWTRHATHIGFAAALLGVILLFKVLNRDAVINTVLKLAGFTYGPLLGLFAFGLFTRTRVRDRAVPFVCAVPPIVCGVLDARSAAWLGGYQFGFELLILNGLLTAVGLWRIRDSAPQPHPREAHA